MTSLSVSSYVTIRERCPMRHRVVDSEIVEFSFGGIRDPFEFVFDIGALREFLRLGETALGEMNERRQASAE